MPQNCGFCITTFPLSSDTKSASNVFSKKWDLNLVSIVVLEKLSHFAMIKNNFVCMCARVIFHVGSFCPGKTS